MFFKYKTTVSSDGKKYIAKIYDGTQFKNAIPYIYIEPTDLEVLVNEVYNDFYDSSTNQVYVYPYGQIKTINEPEWYYDNSNTYIGGLRIYEWDGDTTGRESSITSGSVIAYKISDDLFTNVSEYKVYAMMNGTEVNITNQIELQQGSTSAISDLWGFWHDGYGIGIYSFGPVSATTYGISPGIYFDRASSYRYMCKLEIR